MMTLLFSLALSAASMNAVAAEPATSGSTGKPAKPKKICEKVEVTGSTVPKRVCRTVVEPAKPAAEAQRADAAQPASSGGTN